MTKVGTELLQAFDSIQKAIPESVGIYYVSVNVGTSKTTLEEMTPVLESLEAAGLTAKPKELKFGEMNQDFYLEDGPGWRFKVGVRWKATAKDKIQGMLEEQAKLREELEKLIAKEQDDIPEKEVI